MISKLTKSRSIEDSNTGGSIIGAGMKVGEESTEGGAVEGERGRIGGSAGL